MNAAVDPIGSSWSRTTPATSNSLNAPCADAMATPTDLGGRSCCPSLGPVVFARCGLLTCSARMVSVLGCVRSDWYPRSRLPGWWRARGC